jgi:hypothetical protein
VTCFLRTRTSRLGVCAAVAAKGHSADFSDRSRRFPSDRHRPLQEWLRIGWRRQLRIRQPVGFAPVRIAPDAGVVGSGTIEIEFAAGARMRITGAVDTAALTAAVAVLAEGRRR